LFNWKLHLESKILTNVLLK